MDNIRRKRIRTVVSTLNKARRKQNQKIDLMCNDILAAHNDFINKLQSFRFAADFYENLLGTSSLNEVAETAGEFFTSNIPDTNVVIVFAENANSQLHFYGSNPRLEDIPAALNDSLTGELTVQVCRSNKICRSELLCQLGFTASPMIMKQISIAAIPLSSTSDARGMMVLYRHGENKLRDEELKKAASVMPGLAKAIRACKNPADMASM